LYLWERPDWPEFRWKSELLLPLVTDARFKHGRFLGTMSAAGLGKQQETELSATTDDIVASSKIEGEELPPASVRSSVARRLGLETGGVAPRDGQVEGVAAMVLDATQNFSEKLTEERIFDWHRSLFSTEQVHREPIDLGGWRTDTRGRMQVVSAAYVGGKMPRVHFEAPPADRLPEEMSRFLTWFNAESPDLDGLVRAGIAHLWFLTIHPLDDGNGRIGRAIADMAIAQAEHDGRRFYSLSSAILGQRRAYYEVLERTQKGDQDITQWLVWFLTCHMRAIEQAEVAARKIIDIARFWAAMDAGGHPVNERQRKVLGKLADDWKGFLTTRKWVVICGCSADTAQRDIGDLVARGILVPSGKGGRSAGYTIAIGSLSA
jgi:Fic family protein